MFDSSALQEHLAAVGVIQPGQWEKVESYTREHKVSPVKALRALQIADYPDIGRGLSKATQLPYRPLLESQTSEPASRFISRECAAAWKTFPVDYDYTRGLLTLAVTDPSSPEKLKAIYKFLLQPHELSFTIACEEEIEEALQNLFSPPAATEEKTKEEKESAGKRSLPGLHRKPQEVQPAGTVKPAAVKPPTSMPARPFSPTPPPSSVSDPGYPYEDMARALISEAALMVQIQLAQDHEQLEYTRARARYCRLLASRLGLSASRTDGVVLAAWLSGLEEAPDLLRQVATPYVLEEVLFPDAAAYRPDRVEAQILGLVRCYQELNRREPTVTRDVNLTRGRLHGTWSSSASGQAMLEAFLQVLMDEEFLTELHQTTGHVLIVDPAESATPVLGPPLAQHGYEVQVARDVDAATGLLRQAGVDIILLDAGLPNRQSLVWCRKLKSKPATRSVTLLMLVSPTDADLAVESLRAGADDCLTRPVNLEMMFLKIERMIQAPPEQDSEKGVKGSLSDMSFTDMIQILCAGNKNMEITLTCDSQEGKVFIQNGEVIHATLNDLVAENAFYGLMSWGKGEFVTRPCAEFPERTIMGSAMSLLMEGARLVDEGSPAAESA